MSDPLAGKVAIVTGGASGIGWACARLLAERGARVYSFDLDLPETTEDDRGSAGIGSIQGDVRSEAAVAGAVRRVLDEGGRLDLAVHSAGVEGTGRITDLAEAVYDRCMDTNLKGAFLLAKHAIGPMAQFGGGVLVFIASNAGLLPRVHDPVYCASKAGLVMLTKALALAHARERIRVNAVCPGPVDETRMMARDIASSPDPDAKRRELIAASPMAAALGRMSTPREIALAVGYLVSDDAAMVTGAILAIDGGKSAGVPPRG